MKKFRPIYITAFSIATLLTACNKQLDLQPYQQIGQEQAILTSTDVQITLVGAYNRAGLSDVFGGSVFVEPDLMATQTVVDWQGTYQELTQMVSQTIPNDNSFVASAWLAAYQVINQTNNVLANIDKVDTDEKDRTEGEAKFLRGLTYFNLALLYGRSYNDGNPANNPAVPIVLKPTTIVDASSQVARSSVEEVYNQAITDLTDAEAKLPASNGFYANAHAASAILARLYLQKGDYIKAANEATKVISSGDYELVDNYADEFPYPGPLHVDNTSEDIFAIQVTPQQGVNSLNTYYASADNGGRGDIVIKESFVESFEDGDERTSVYNYDSDDYLRVDKFDNLYGNVHVIRLAELYLIRAEANFRNASAIGDAPADDINVIRDRAGLGPLVGPVTIGAILTERRHELAFEGGFFLHDAKRLKLNIGVLPYNSPKLVFPVPQREIYANPNLVQNQGY
jgi:tetratricopeptide (TPR) repeat protein